MICFPKSTMQLKKICPLFNNQLLTKFLIFVDICDFDIDFVICIL